jgi:hypothetical protein
MVILGASESYENRGNIEELTRAIGDSTRKIEIIKNNFDTLLYDIFDEMIETDKNLVYVLAERFQKEIETLPDFVDLYAISVEIDPMTSDVKATEESEVLIEICKEHESYFEYYIDIQKTLINIYKD